MTRHSKNNTSSGCYSYHERQLDTAKSGYGTQKQRLNKDSIKDFDACSLTLQFCRDPVVTDHGVLFDKEAILQYIVQKKVDLMKKVKEYDRQIKKEERELAELAAAEKKDKVDKFLKVEKGVVLSSSLSSYKSDNSTNTQSKKEDDDQAPSVSNMQESHANKLPSFWVPTNTPEFKATKLKKPDPTIYCPITGEPIRAKDLIPVKFTLIDPNDDKNFHSKKDRYKCPVTHDVLSNSIPCAVLKTSGSVVTMECVERFLRKDMIDPINGKKMKDSDIIRIQTGGTGFAHTNKLVAELRKPVMQA